MVYFCNLQFKGLTFKNVISDFDKYKQVLTVNSEFIVKAQKEKRLARLINEKVSTFDGQVPYLLAKIKNSRQEFTKISGSDLIYDLCSFAKKNNKKVFLLGGKSRSNYKSIEILKMKYNIEISGYSPEYRTYPFGSIHNELILTKIREFKPDILLVGFGAVKQEYWISDNEETLESIGVKIALGCGGTFEFVSGEIPRAPESLQKLGLEGVYRFFQEPKLFRLKRLIISLGIIKYL